jgi:LEA14-like dessication related protein
MPRGVRFEPSKQPLIDETSNSVYGDLYSGGTDGRRRRFCGCFASRRACVSVVCLVVLIAVTALGVAAYFWLVPLLAARAIANVSFVVSSAQVTSPSSSAFHLALTVAIGTVPVAVRIDACDVELLYGAADAVLGTTRLPDIEIAAGASSVLSQNSTFNITDFQLLNVMFDDLLNDAVVHWTLRATTSAVVWGVPFDQIVVRKVLTLAGFDGFPNRTIDAFGVAGVPANGQGVLVYCTTSITNASPISMRFNNASFELLANGNVSIGRVQQAGALSLTPGTQALSLNGSLYAGDDVVKAAAIGDLVSAMLRSGSSSNVTAAAAAAAPVLTVRGVSATSDSGDSLPWLDNLMQSFEISEAVPPLVDPQPLRDIVFDTVSIVFGEQISANITTSVTFFIPPQFAFPFDLLQARLEMSMLFNGSVASTLSVPWTSVETIAPQRVRVTATNVSVQFHQDLFSALLIDAFNAAAFTISTAGRAWATLRSPIATELTLSDVPFAASVPIRGCNSFENGLFLESVQLVASQPGVAFIVGVINVINNATLAAAPGTFTLGVFVDGVYVGNATAAAPYLPVGFSTHNVTGFLVQTPTNLAQRQKLISQYATNRRTNVQLRGSTDGTAVPVLKLAFDALRSNTTFPGLNSTGLLLGVELTIDWLGLSAAGIIQVANPLAADIVVQAANFDVFFNGTKLGSANQKLNPPITVPANSTTMTGALDVHVILSWTDLLALYSLLCQKETLVSCNGTLSFQVGGGFQESDLPYTQHGVPIALFHLPNNGTILPCP